MNTEQELKGKCTPKLYLWLMELSGFNYLDQIEFSNDNMHDKYFFPLLIHRAVEGWNKKNKDKAIDVLNFKDYIQAYHISTDNKYDDIDYQPTTLTHAEMAMLDCLIDIFEEEKK